MQFEILTIFPKIITDYIGESILKRGLAAGLIKITAHDFRKFTTDRHQKVDDSPYGGGAGMVLKVEPIYNCLESLGLVKNGQKKKQVGTKVIIMDPAGKKFDQKKAKQFSKLKKLVIICGRYEGFDERVYKFVDEKISLGDYVLSGGELGALAITEAVSRLRPGVLGNKESLKEETFEAKKNMAQAEYPHYTRPEVFKNLKVPKILLSGDHQKIYDWRLKKSR
ncbi:MAG TPA: tRNA (guanosine(37)-N1)-methyltransferase TrmD [Candidatus Magasanikbacteria bacterium]|nr:tRNA (guanosine(37)-N1)-methyltransferase TrmD [Candidatus Magasanikbacteria bacterium]